MLGDRALGMSLQAGGTWADIGGQIVYVNRQHRWNWAATVEALPYRTGFLTLEQKPGDNLTVLTEVIDRQTSRGVFGTAAYPLNSASRFEVTGGARQLTFTRETRTNVYAFDTGDLLQQTKTTDPPAAPLYLAEGRLALVHDTSFFGATSPIFGARSRLEVGQSMGSLTYTTVLTDARRYFMPVRPVTVAVRGLQFSRWGPNREDPHLVELYAGYPELVHGYGLGSFDARDCDNRSAGGTCAVFNNLRGSGIFVANIEVRAPLLGLRRREINYGRVPIEVAGFFDAGLVWSSDNLPSFAGGTRQIVRSAGVATRVNVFGFFVLEVSASHPFDRIGGGMQWQVGLRQGF
jgi:hypothetical protein